MTMNKFEDQRNGQGQTTPQNDTHNLSSADVSRSRISGENTHNMAKSARSSSIGQALKSVYQQTVEEDLPEDFQKLLDQLK